MKIIKAIWGLHAPVTSARDPSALPNLQVGSGKPHIRRKDLGLLLVRFLQD